MNGARSCGSGGFCAAPTPSCCAVRASSREVVAAARGLAELVAGALPLPVDDPFRDLVAQLDELPGGSRSPGASNGAARAAE